MSLTECRFELSNPATESVIDIALTSHDLPPAPVALTWVASGAPVGTIGGLALPVLDEIRLFLGSNISAKPAIALLLPKGMGLGEWHQDDTGHAAAGLSVRPGYPPAGWRWLVTQCASGDRREDIPHLPPSALAHH